MNFEEVKLILKRLFKEHVKKHMKRILVALVLSIIVAGSTSGIAWLLDPAVKKIFIEQNDVFAWTIPVLIIIAFSSKGLSLYFARINIIRVGEEVAGEIQKKIASNILISDIQTLDNRHSGKYISNVMFDSNQIRTLVSSGVLNLMKDTFSVIALVALMFYQNWKLALFAILMMPLAAILAKSLGKRIGKATSKAGESSGILASFLSEIFKGSKMIRIYQKENQVAIITLNRPEVYNAVNDNLLNGLSNALKTARDDQDIREQDRSIQTVSPYRLQRDFTCQFRGLNHFQKWMFCTQFAIIGHVTASLAHQPDRGCVGRLFTAGFQKSIGSGHGTGS